MKLAATGPDTKLAANLLKTLVPLVSLQTIDIPVVCAKELFAKIVCVYCLLGAKLLKIHHIFPIMLRGNPQSNGLVHRIPDALSAYFCPCPSCTDQLIVQANALALTLAITPTLSFTLTHIDQVWTCSHSNFALIIHPSIYQCIHSATVSLYICIYLSMQNAPIQHSHSSVTNRDIE